MLLFHVPQGISSFASSASKLAAKASENAAKFGSIATQKVSEISESVNEKVKEGTIVNDLQSQVSTIGSKVFDVGKKGITDLSSLLGQRMSLYEDPNRGGESFDGGDYGSNGYQSYQNSAEGNTYKPADKSESRPLKESHSLHSSKSTPANLTAQAISREEQVLGNARSVKKKTTEEDDFWAMLGDEKPKKSSNRKK